MIFIGLGANMESVWGAPAATFAHLEGILSQRGIFLKDFSPLFRTEPVGPRQPAYVNAVAAISCTYPPQALLAMLKRIEIEAGRCAGQRNGPRPLDLDILDYHGRIMNWGGARDTQRPLRSLVLPHPRLHMRRFVLEPLLAMAPGWRHPVFGIGAARLAARLPRKGQGAILERLTEASRPLIEPASCVSAQKRLVISD
jgi:2-amino-4-hydroxy-6-hydroxymethyldihydropteridine diphosphokinase